MIYMIPQELNEPGRFKHKHISTSSTKMEGLND